MQHTLRSLIDVKTLVIPLILALLLLVFSQVSFLLFHTLAEFFAIVVAILLSVVAWQMYSFTRNHFLMYLGCGYFWIAALDMVHALTYKGMSIIPITGSDIAIQLWLSARYLEALLLLTAPSFLVHQLNRNIAITFFGFFAFIVLIIIMSDSFPTTFVEGKGLTEFKVFSEYLIIAFLAVAVFYLAKQRRLMDQRVFVLIIMSIIFTMIAELAFTFYINVYGFSNFVGHIFKLFSFWLIFVAVVRTTLRDPYSAMSKAETYYNAVPDVTILTDKEGIIQNVNDQACLLVNQSSIELIGKQAHSIFHDSKINQLDCPVCQSIKIGTELSAYEMKTGETSWFDFSTRLIHGENSYIEVIRNITNKKRTMLALEKNEARLSITLNSIGDAVITTDIYGNVTRMNPVAERLTGWDFLDALGQPVTIIFSIIDASNLEPIENPIDKVMSTGQMVYFGNDTVLISKDGTKYNIEDSAAPIIDNDGNIYGMVLVFNDGTERKKMEVALKDSENKLLRAQEIANTGSWKLYPETAEIEGSEELLRIFGLGKNELTLDNFASVVHPDDREYDLKYIQNGIEHGVPWDIEHRLLLKDNSIKWVRAIGEPQKDNEGNVISIIGVVQDITERNKTEQSLKRVNRSLQALSACNEALVRAVNEDELLNKVCQIIVKISGYKLAWVAFSEHDEEKNISIKAKSGGDKDYFKSLNITWADEERGQGPTGTAIRTGKYSIARNIMEDSSYEPWRKSAKKYGYNSSIALPLKNKKQTFGTLNIYANEVDAFDEEEVNFLQELVKDLAYGIDNLHSREERNQLNKQLQQAQKMEAIGQLTGGIAHDFNNILASIMGFTSLALQRFVKDEQAELREYLEEVSSAGERARDLVSQMLVFSRTTTSDVQPLQLPPLIKEVIKMLQATLPSTIHLSSQIDKNLPSVIMDPVHIQQILMNLCINARDAITNKGNINIRVNVITSNALQNKMCDSCHHKIEEGSYIELLVQDAGAGIDDNKLKQIFDPFFTTKDIGKGTGMGLSMVHGIVHQYGGHILVDSKLGTGTTFRLLLPVSEKNLLCEMNSAVEIRKSTEIINDARLLIIDDEESVGRFIGDLMESHGAKVTVMSDSLEGMDLFSQNPTAFDLVITDQTMPGLTGTELASQILALRSDMPIILCTGFSENINEEKAKELGIRGYIYKPMELNPLLNLVVQMLSG
jgi:PAS domain S-box-containing protein